MTTACGSAVNLSVMMGGGTSAGKAAAGTGPWAAPGGPVWATRKFTERVSVMIDAMGRVHFILDSIVGCTHDATAAVVTQQGRSSPGGGLRSIRRLLERGPQAFQRDRFRDASRYRLVLQNNFLRLRMSRDENYGETLISEFLRGRQAVHHRHIEIGEYDVNLRIAAAIHQLGAV